MNTSNPADTHASKDGLTDAAHSGTGMHRPGHSALDAEETACLDEVQLEAALRDSTLRVPR